jgi:hypothetical protein
MKKICAKDRRILVIPDTHAPFEHPDTIRFLSAIKDKYLEESSLIMHLGDEVDGNQISFHDKDPDIRFSPCTELEAAIEFIQKLYKLFPKVYLCESNHGSLVYRRQKYAGLPRHVMKSYQEILGTPNWTWAEEYWVETNLGGVYLCHFRTSTSGRLSKEMGSYGSVSGHVHSRFETVWSTNGTQTRFDVFSGCLVSRQSMAFAYGKLNLPKPVLGCLLISSRGQPTLIRMMTKKNDRWDGTLP